MAKAIGKCYQLKISLNDAKPPIWRRVLISDSVPLPLFHDVIQIAMGWTDSHLHQFIAHGEYFGTPDPVNDFMDMVDERSYKLSQLLKTEKASIRYEYDFGDGWTHTITLEKILPLDPETALPICIKGKGACPPEDVGGIWGYYNFLEALADPEHPEHAEYKEWIGGDFDPNAFDLDQVNTLLNEHCR